MGGLILRFLLEMSGWLMLSGGSVFGTAFSPFLVGKLPKPPFCSRFFMHRASRFKRVPDGEASVLPSGSGVNKVTI